MCRTVLAALDIRKRDEVIVPANSFVATAFTASDDGATPVFADVDERTFNFDVDAVERLVTMRTRADLVGEILFPTGSSSRSGGVAAVCTEA